MKPVLPTNQTNLANTPVKCAEGAMVFDQLLLKLTEPQETYQEAVALGRMGFLEWLVSLPNEDNFNEQAMRSYERAAPLKQVVPAIGVLCDLLLEATRMPSEESMESNAVALRRTRARRRRSSH